MDEKTKQRVERRFAEAGIDVFGSSPESGDRRQEAANDHGSERSSSVNLIDEIIENLEFRLYDTAMANLGLLRSEVSARSADAAGVLEEFANWLKMMGSKCDREAWEAVISSGDYERAASLYVKHQTYMSAWHELKDLQNQSSKPGPG